MTSHDEKPVLKRTPLYERHLELGAKMVEFAGWEMPVKYTTVIEEHLHVRKHAGIFDISHMGEFVLEGPDCIPFLQKMMTNDVGRITDGMAQYSCMCYPNGTVVDDLIYYRITPERFIIIVNASNTEKDFKWLNEHREGFNVSLTDRSSKRGRLAFQGPKTQELLQPLVDIDLSTIKRFHFRFCNLKGAQGDPVEIFIARTGYTGEDGFEISCDADKLLDVFNALLNTGAKPIGLGARDSLRLEMAYSLYGHEINENITPVEASIGWVVKEKDGIDFIGKEVLLKQKKEGTSRKLVGLILKDKGIIRANYKVVKLHNHEEELGYITSGGYSPSLEKSIALALIKTEYAKVGDEVGVVIRNRVKTAEIVKTPFYKKNE